MRSHRFIASILFLLAIPAIGQDYSGPWCGTTSQGKSLFFRVVNNQVTYAHLTYVTNGTGSCPVGSSKSFTPPVAIVNGRVTFGQPTAPIGTAVPLWSVIATFNSSSEASGTFSVAVSASPVGVCGGVNPGASGSWTATKAAIPLAVSPMTQTFGSGGGLGRINVSASDGCSWSASTTAIWISLFGSSDDGAGAVTYLVSSNTTNAARSTTITVEDLTSTISQGTTPDVRQLPVVGSTPGSLGSFFKTAVQIHNRTTTTMQGRFVFHPQGTSGTDADPSLSYSLPSGATQHYPDLLPALSQAGLGSVDVVSTAGGFPVAVTRIFNDAGAAGTTGMTEDLLRKEEPLTQGTTGVLIAPPDPAAARFNVGVRTLANGTTMTVTLRGSDGSVKKTLAKTYGPTFFEQVSSAAFLGTTLAGSDTIALRIDSGDAIVYGSTTDNKTQDPSLQIARSVAASGSTGETRILTVIGSAPGSLGSFFKTAVQIHNPQTSVISGRFVFHPQGLAGSSSDPSMNYSLAPGQTLAFNDLLPSMGQSGLGSVDVVSTAGPLPITVARIYNDAGENGTTGMSQELIPMESVLRRGESAILLAPPDLNAARYNIGIRTLDGGASMNINVKDSSGKVVKTLTKTFAPMFFQQVSAASFIEGDLPASGSLFIFISSGSAILYGATTDNKTQDPSVQFANRFL